ncbi:MAG: hypothetical protein GXP25_11510 [Planctomycetes bacterium]|nr:hypothetical protein [Planctomycetota bacterium]
MRLAIKVGILADLKSNDSEGYEYYRDQFETINHALATAGLPLHHEPEGNPASVWGCDLPRAAVHGLRRIAAYEAFEYDIPAQGYVEGSRHPVVVDYYREIEGTPLVRLKRLLFRTRRGTLRFQHLMVHSDGEGYYLPLKFEEVIRPDPALRIAGGRVGSSPVLLEECTELADLLEVPEDLAPDSEELWQAVERPDQNEGGCRWRRYALESLACVCIMEACRVSIASGAAIVFT